MLAAGAYTDLIQLKHNSLAQVTLVWTDPPADPSAARSLVNDLDLTVNADSLNGYSLHGNGAKDYVNNAEQVRRMCCSLLHASQILEVKRYIDHRGSTHLVSDHLLQAMLLVPCMKFLLFACTMQPDLSGFVASCLYLAVWLAYLQIHVGIMPSRDETHGACR